MTDDDRENTPDEDKEYKKRKQKQQERAMEGNVMIRSISEPITLKNNIFIDMSKKKDGIENEEEELQPGQLNEDDVDDNAEELMKIL